MNIHMFFQCSSDDVPIHTGDSPGRSGRAGGVTTGHRCLVEEMGLGTSGIFQPWMFRGFASTNSELIDGDWNLNCVFFHILGISSSKLIFTSFQRG